MGFGSVADFLREVLSGAAIKLQGLIETLPPSTLVLLFADLGFAENPAFNTRERYAEQRCIHGGASLFEVIAPAVVLYRVRAPRPAVRNGGCSALQGRNRLRLTATG